MLLLLLVICIREFTSVVGVVCFKIHPKFLTGAPASLDIRNYREGI
ncbi:MAG: hypothetical protein KME29_08985 [Calothrix sp. FI2-JRJ7]|nr:hypothetical protein [Calothrix sp. FI2-JRJ7]